MKPAPFSYERPVAINAALALAGASAGTARFLAGGQSLGPMLNLRLAQPDLIIDLTAIPELTRVEESAEDLLLGACITHADIEDGRVPDVTGGILPRVAHGIAYRAVRNRGTIGGSLAHADPAADWLTCLSALGGSVVLRGADGHRSVAVGEFVEGAFQTALGEGEMVEAVRIPRVSAGARWGYCKIVRKAGDFADAMAAVLFDAGRGACRATIGATDSRPIVVNDAGATLFGGQPERGLGNAFSEAAARDLLARAIPGDAIARQLHLVALKRAIAAADAP